MVKKADKIWMDGALVNWDDANVHVLTHTLHYGLGAFEGVRCYQRADGRSHIFRLNDHTQRLLDSSKLVFMDVPFTLEELNEAQKQTLLANGQSSAYLRPIVFLGDGKMGLYAIDNPVRVAVVTWEWGAYLGEDGLKNGIRAKISSWTRNHHNSMMPKGKINGHYVNSILAKREAMLGGYDEAIMLDHEGYISEASGENIFIVKNGVLKTPPASSSILGGITRDTVITIAQDMGIEVTFGRMSRDELYLADEVFFTGTAAEITPVREIDDRPIGCGSRGVVTERVQTRYFDILTGDNPDYDHWLDYIN